MTAPATEVDAPYLDPGPGCGIYARLMLLREIPRRAADINPLKILAAFKTLQNGPLDCRPERLHHRYGADLLVLWAEGFYILYRAHKPKFGPYRDLKWLVHILDVDSYRITAEGARKIRILENPDEVRRLSERDGELIWPEYQTLLDC
jgi:hypothetical protein